jgi:hypothetical protein
MHEDSCVTLEHTIMRLPEGIVVVPLAPPRADDLRKCRPIGIYEPSRALVARYEEDSRQ